MRKQRRDFSAGPPGSKTGLNTIRGGLNSALFQIEQTTGLNISQAEVDSRLKTLSPILDNLLSVIGDKVADMVGPKGRANRDKARIAELGTLLVQVLQLYQTLAGHATRRQEVQMKTVLEALEEIGFDEEKLDAFAASLAKKRAEIEAEAAREGVDLAPAEEPPPAAEPPKALPEPARVVEVLGSKPVVGGAVLLSEPEETMGSSAVLPGSRKWASRLRRLMDSGYVDGGYRPVNRPLPTKPFPWMEGMLAELEQMYGRAE